MSTEGAAYLGGAEAVTAICCGGARERSSTFVIAIVLGIPSSGADVHTGGADFMANVGAISSARPKLVQFTF